MKVLVYVPLLAVWRPRLPTILSVTQELIDDGHEVIVIGCNGTVDACTANLDHTRAICNYCIKRRQTGFELLTGSFSERSLDDYLAPGLAAELAASTDEIPDLTALRALRYKDADVGYAAFSSYAYVARKPKPSLEKRVVQQLVQNLVNTGKIVYEAIGAAIEREQPDKVILHHGRSAIDRAALRACQSANVECLIYETALSLDRLLCFKNALPHDIQNFASTVNARWDEAPDDKVEVGKAFFEMRRSGVNSIETDGRTLSTQDRSFISRQDAGRLPDEWDPALRNITIYGTSNDEFIAISPEYEDRVYPSQVDALDQLSKSLEKENVHFYFRIHPRQAGVEDDLTRALDALKAERDNISIIPANSDISSYALLDGSEVALTFRSTMSMEAAYWGKPCLILSASIYKPLGASYNPRTHEEVVQLIRSDLEPKDRTPALKFGYYQMTSGIEQRYYGGDIGKGRRGYTFKGNPVLLGGVHRLRYWASRERQRLKWRRLI